MPLIIFTFLGLGFPTISYYEKKMFFLMFFIHLKKNKNIAFNQYKHFMNYVNLKVKLLNPFFKNFFHVYVQEFLKIYPPNSIKKIKKDYKKKLAKDMKTFPKKKKKKKGHYGYERYKNLSGDEKQNLVEYRKKYCKIRKKRLLIKSNDSLCFFESIYRKR